MLGALLWALAPGTASPQVVPRLDHVAVIILENKSYDQTRTQTYTASLIAAGVSFSASYAITHPSQPNYIALWSGGTQGVVNDNCLVVAPLTAENLGHACEAAGLTWKAYSEDLPAVGSNICFNPSLTYTRKHDPWTNFSNLNHANEVPYTQLALDIAAGTLPNLVFIVPNNCDNSHNNGCTVQFADAWLAAQVPSLLAAVGPRGLVVLTWDEDDSHSANHILTVLSGPAVLAGYVSPQHVTHYTILRMLSETLGLTPFAAAPAEASITDVWAPTIGVQGTTFGALKTLYR